MNRRALALAPSDQALRHLVRDSPDGIVVVDRRGIVLFANPAAERFLRPPDAPLVGTGFGFPVAGRDGAEVECPATGATVLMRVVETDWEGRPAWLVTLHEVTEARRADTQRAQMLALLEQAERVAHLGVLEFDLRTGEGTRTAGISRILGRDVTDLPDDPLRTSQILVHPEDRQRWLTEISAALAGRMIDMRHRIVRPDGETRTVRLVAEPVLGDDGTPVKVRAVMRDITEEKAAREALRVSEERFRLLAEHSQDVIFLLRLTPGPRIEYMSPAARTLLGRPPEALVGDLDRFIEVLEPADRSAVQAVLSSPGLDPVVVGCRRPDDSVVWLEVRGYPIFDDAGQPVAVEGDLRDVTARVSAERERQRLTHQLAQAERMDALGRVVGGVAHDFNNLLGVIMGVAELALGDLTPGEPLRADVEQIAHAAQRGAALARQLLIFSRRQPTQAELLDLNEVTSKVEQLLSRTIGEDVRIQTTLAPGLKPVNMDRVKLEQVVMNLVVNARDAMPGGGRLLLRTAAVVTDHDFCPPTGQPVPAGDYVRLTVADTGHGVTDEVARRIFEPFFTTRERGKGTGLGLATVHGVVTEAGGYVTLHSRPGHGAVFDVYLPAAEGTAAAPAGPATDAPAGRRETVLLVEDEPAVRDVVLRILSRNNYRVLTTDSSLKALELGRRRDVSVDLLLTDVVMPGMSGPQLAERLQAVRPGLPVLYMSGYPDGHQASGPMPATLGKPFEAATVLRRIRQTLDQGSDRA